MKHINPKRLEAILGSMDLHNLGYACLFSRPLSTGGEGSNQKVHMDWNPQNYKYYARFKARESSGPVSMITAMSPEGAWLDIWWVYTDPDEAFPRHPTDRPRVRIFIKYGDTLVFRHDLWWCHRVVTRIRCQQMTQYLGFLQSTQSIYSTLSCTVLNSRHTCLNFWAIELLYVYHQSFSQILPRR